MQSSQSNSTSERRREQNPGLTISQLEQRQLVEHGEEKIETEVEFASMSSGSSDELDISKPPLAENHEVHEVNSVSPIPLIFAYWPSKPLDCSFENNDSLFEQLDNLENVFEIVFHCSTLIPPHTQHSLK